MLRLLFPGLLVIHGLIHLMGFSKEWNLGPPMLLKGKSHFAPAGPLAKFFGFLWLLVCILLVGAATLYRMNVGWYGLVALVGVGLSQTLIVFYWQDVKYGTFFNIILAVIIVLKMAHTQFDEKTEVEISVLKKNATPVMPQSKRDTGLPVIVQKWLLVSGAFSSTYAVARVKHTGAMRTTRDGRWMNFQAQQYCSVNPPAFLWKATIQAAPFVFIAGRDQYAGGVGNMLIKPLFIYTMANTSGPEIDQGSMLRFLSEMIWYPEAATQPYMHWKEIAPLRATATMSYKGVTAMGTFTFLSDGRVASVVADRFGDFDGVFRKEVWQVNITGYKKMNGRLVPAQCEVTWKLNDGDFTWLKLNVTHLEHQ
ncbi:DUF6544 family protein [Chryseolinea lacunae]|uniref:Uncharacterized protein n=1 Tax=Chryseolinea lacunae TaxID=2801331 RepID=A0ABS1KMD6_9BACT|nr:DUF6544 family protein [Chryseolinea lacunae]MBL0740495.1 hypothetical protein [Chryseolinea lacunae]